MTGFESCPCRCDTCADCDCDGTVCAPHAEGRWIVLGLHLSHPLPNDFDTQADAEDFVETIGWKNLRVEQAA